MAGTGPIVRCSCGFKVGSLFRLLSAQMYDNQPVIDDEAMLVCGKIREMKRHHDLGHRLKGHAFEYEITRAAEALAEHESGSFVARFDRSR